ncbi:oligosaccharide flippase family protein [Streptomyces sp. NPDC001792]|uniref:oligosaccharide flippase family protein n=1 Tax=Streptomyces sp. NPDC001792 TaxID=3154524 RepID=UPI003322C431
MRVMKPHRRVRHGASSVLISLGWNYAGAFAATLLQLGYAAWTGRAASAEAFGVYAIALTVTQVFGYFANAGLASHVMRIEELTGSVVKAALRLGTASGVVVFVMLQTVAQWCGDLWQMPALPLMLRLLSCQLLVQPGAAVAVTVLRRIGLVRTAVACELAAQAGGIAVGTILMACGWNPLGLAATQPATAVLTLALGASVIVARSPIPDGPPVRARDLIMPSSFLAGYSLVEFLTSSAPMWAVGRLFGAGVTGAYSRAGVVTGLTSQFLFQGLNSAVSPVLAERRKRGLEGASAVARTVCSASAAALIGFGVLVGLGPVALGLLLGPGWNRASELLPVLAVGAAATLLCRSGMIIDQVRHATGALLSTQFAVTAATAAAVCAAIAWRSLFLLAVAVAVGQVAGHVVQVLGWHRNRLVHASFVVRAHTVHGLVGLALDAAATFGAVGRPPATGLVCGLASMAPVALMCVLVRRRIPVYTAVAAMGLSPFPRFRRKARPLDHLSIPDYAEGS